MPAPAPLTAAVLAAAPGAALGADGAPAGVREAAGVLADGGATEDELADLVERRDGPAGLPLLFLHLERWARAGALRHEVREGGEVVAALVALTPRFRPAAAPGPDAALVLSRFAVARREGSALAVESPLALARVILGGTAGAAVLAALATPARCAGLCARLPGSSEAVVEGVLGLLVAAGLAGAEGEEDADEALAPWSPVDLLFHTRSRRGRHAEALGATYPLAGRTAPLPAVRPPGPGPVLALPRPQGEREDPGFFAVLERRRSVRHHARRPIALAELGELLVRTARVRGVTPADPARGRPYATSSRPYPSAGAAYDLELYLTIDRCAGLDPGVHHYDPLAHALRQVAGRTAAADALLEDARRATGAAERPQVLVTLASRFGRLGWKYSGIAYALALKNAGALQATLCLAASALGLGACPVGTGDVERFAEASGTDWRLEPAVGELVLGVPA